MGAETALLAEFKDFIQALPGLTLRSLRQPAPDKPIDAEMLVEVQGRLIRILLEAKHFGYPRDLRDAARQIEQYRHDYQRKFTDSEIVPMILAPNVSPGSKELLRAQHTGYWDQGGSFYLEAPGTLYFIDRPTPSTGKRLARSLYRGRAAQVLHAMLVNPGQKWHVAELASLAQVSSYTVHHVFTSLERQLWVERRGSGPRAVRVLLEPGQMLDSWAGSHSMSEYTFRRYHCLARSAPMLRHQVTRALDKIGIDYALTLASGAALVAPFISGDERLSVIVPFDVDLDQLVDSARLRPVDEGENVVFLASRDQSPLLFRQKIQDAWVASNVQLYLDLHSWPMRGKEQAQHLRTERLSY